jgi:hypothetical protein
MPITIACTSDGCDQWHEIGDQDYQRQGAGILTSLYTGKCPACRKKFDDMLAELTRLEAAREANDRLRDKAEELVRDYGGPPAMVGAIVDLVREEVRLTAP